MSEKNEIKDMVQAILEGLLPTVMAAGIQLAKPKGSDDKPFDRSQCSECKQMVGACKGQHESVVVYPQGEQFETFFQGFILNGIVYNSGATRLPIKVPKGCGAANAIQLWEQQEKNQAYGIKKKNVTKQFASTV